MQRLGVPPNAGLFLDGMTKPAGNLQRKGSNARASGGAARIISPIPEKPRWNMGGHPAPRPIRSLPVHSARFPAGIGGGIMSSQEHPVASYRTRTMRAR